MLLIILLFHFLLLGYTSGQNNNGGCKIDDIPTNYIKNFPIKDTDINKNLLSASYTGLLSDLKCTSSNENVMGYFSVSIEKGKFTVQTTDKLADIDKNTAKQSDPSVVLSMNCDMSCDAGTSNLMIQFIVTDTNNHAPTFLEKEYSYKVASPIMPFSHFTIYGKKIIVEDLDFSNKDVTFSIVPDDFTITTSTDGKHYTAQLTSKKIIQLTGKSLIYTITATDSEATPEVKSTSQKITIQSDSSKSLDNPWFKNPSYSFDYSVEGTTVTLTPRDGPISLTTNKPESIANSIKLIGEYKDNFTPTFNPTDKTITLEATPLTSTASITTLTLSVETDAVATTSIVVYLPGKPTPKFSSHVYTATYTVDNTVKLDEDIGVTASWGTPEVTLSGDFKDHFKLNPSGKTYDLTVSKKLSGSDLKSLTQLMLTITAKIAEESDESVLIIKLPEHQLQFTSALYDAMYDTDSNTVTVDKSHPIAFSTAVESIDITASGTYSEHFSFTYDAALKNCKVTVKTPLPSDILLTLQEVSLTLSAKDSYEFEASAVLKIAIPKTEAPEFSSALYQAQYPKEGTGLIDFENALSFTNIADPGKVTISLDSYQENFEVVYKSTKWQLQVKKALDDSTLETLSQIVATLEATEEGNTLIGSSVLVLELPKTRPEFSETLYTAKYPKKGTGVIDFQNPLDFKNVDDGDKISITLNSYSENFLIEESSGKWQIKIQKPLDDSTLKTVKELIITMEASGDLYTKTGLSVLVMQLPEQDPDPKPPEFSNANYEADYPEKGTGIINFKSAIEFSEITDVSDITIELSDYTKNFAIIYDPSVKSWQIQINSPLDKSVLESESSIILTLTAKRKGVEGSGKATLVMNLPTKAAEVAPIFSKSYYVAKYQYEASGDPSVSLVDDISVTNKVDLSQVSIVADDYSDNFEIKNDGKKWSVQAKSPLSDSVLKDRTDLVVSIKATDKTNGMSSSSVIDLQLPVITEDAPKFSKTFYTAKYSVLDGKGVVTLDDPLEILNRKNLEQITITTDNYIDNFKITYDTKTKKWVIAVNANLDDPTLKSKVDIVMELTASDSTTGDLGTATLVVALPEVNIEEAPKFSSIFYQAEYNPKTTVLETDIKITNKKVAEKVTVSIDKAYEKYFDISLDKAKSIWHVNVVTPLPNSETKDKEDLVLTLTATETDNTAVGKAALVLTLPIKTAISFSKAQYYADYTVENNKASMTMEDIVITNRETSSNILLAVGGNFEKHFSYHYDSVKNTWKIILRDPFSEEELGDNREFIMTLTAEDQDDGSLGTATFIINLPSKDGDETALEFSQVHYEGAYVEEEGTAKVNLDKNIEITSKKSLDDLKLTIQSADIDANKYFELKKTTEKYEVTVLEALPMPILQNQKSLVLTLEADLAGIKSYATLVINLPKIVDDGDISFSEVLYNGRYEVTDGKVKLSVDTIQVKTTATDANVEVSISADSSYKTFFAVSYAGGKVTLSTVNDLPEDILKQTPVIPLTLVIAIKGKPDRALAVLNIAVSYDEAGDTHKLAFEKFLYNGKYKGGNPTQDEDISIITDQPDDQIEVSVNNEYKDFFVAQYSGGKVTIAKGPSEIPAETLKSLTNIPLLMLAKIKGTIRTATAVINLVVASDAPIETPTLAFAQLLYNGDYSIVEEKIQFQVKEKIEVNTDALEEDIDSAVTIESEYAEYFKATYASKTVTVQALNRIPDDVMKSKTFIALKLTIKTKDSSVSSSAVLNIEISNDAPIDTLAFGQLLYTGDYSIVNEKIEFQVKEKIVVNTDVLDDKIDSAVAIDSEYAQYFKATYDSKTVTVQALNRIPDEVMKTIAFITLKLTIKTKDSSISSSAVLNIEIVSSPDVDTTSIAFSEVLYNGKYDLTGESPVITFDTISLITDQTDEHIQVEISNGYKTYFSVKQTDKKVVVSSTNPIPADTLKSLTTIAITLTAQIVGSGKSSSAVLNLGIINSNTPIESRTLAFAELLYTGDYSIVNEKIQFQVKEDMKVITDALETDIDPAVTIDSEYAEYFKATYASKTVTVQALNQIPDDVLKAKDFIALKLTIKTKDSSVSSSAVLNIEISSGPDDDTASIAFSEVLYNGKYDLTGESPVITFDTISLITDQTDDHIQVEISNGYKTYFSVKQTAKKVVVSSTSPIPADTLKSLTTIAITLTAQIVGSDKSSSAVLNLGIINSDTPIESRTLAFAELLYTGDYSIVNEKIHFQVKEDIKVITDALETDIDPAVTIDSEYAEYFKATYASKTVTVQALNRIPDDVLKAKDFIALKLTIKTKDSSVSSSAVLNIEISSSPDVDTTSIAFSEVLYNGKYDLTGKSPVITSDTISLITDQTDEHIQVEISNGYKTYFSVKQTDKKVVVSSTSPIPADTLKSLTTIAITLTAQIVGSDKSSSAVLNLGIINSDAPIESRTLAFAELLYTGDYSIVNEKIQFQVKEDIKVITDALENDIDPAVTIDSEYAEYFKATYASKTVTVQALNQIPDDVLKAKDFIALKLTIKTKDSLVSSSAVLNIEISSSPDVDTTSIAFSEVLYNGKYDLTGESPVITFDTISLITDQTDEHIQVEISNGYKTYFSVKQTDKKVVVSSTSPIPADTLKSLTTIAITLTAQIVGSGKSSSAVLNLGIINSDVPIESRTLAFAELLYTGDYSIVNEKIQFQVKEDIKVITDALENDIDPAVTIDSEYAEYFKATYASKTVTVQALKQIPGDVLKAKDFIALKLTIKTKDSLVSSSAVLNIEISSSPDVDTTSIAFSEVLYNGKYDLTGESPVITFDTISLITDQTDEHIQVEISNGYKTYFSVKQTDKKVVVSSTSPIPADTLKSLTTIAITLTAQVVGSDKSSSAVLNLGIINSDTPIESRTLAFAELLYTGDYSIVNEKIQFQVREDIKVITDALENDIDPAVTIDSEYAEYFKATYASKTVTVQALNEIPDDVLKAKDFIALKLTIKTKDSSVSSSAVLNIGISNGKDDTTEVTFTSFIYNGEYQIADDKASIRHDPIKVETDQADDSVVISIGNEYASYFFIHYSKKLVTVELKNTVPSSILQQLTNIPVELSVQIKGNQHSSFAVLNLKVIGENDTNNEGVIAFHNVLYNGKYTVGDNPDKPKFTVDKIRIFTENLQSDIKITVWNDYNYDQYFNFSYSNNEVSVSLIKQLPANVYKNINFIPITLTAKVANSEVAPSSAVLNIEVDYSNHDDNHTESSVDTTGYVAAIVVLALLLAGLLAGGGAFYFFKIRNRAYSTMDDEDYGRIKFDKQSRPSSKSLGVSSLEERRPTGYNFNPITEGDLPKLETSPNTAENKERRKSVAFNENVQKLELDAVNDDELDKGEVTSL